MQCFPLNFSRGAVNLIPSTAQRRRWFEIVISGLIIPTYLLFSNFSSMATGAAKNRHVVFQHFLEQFSNQTFSSPIDVRTCPAQMSQSVWKEAFRSFLACGHRTLPGRCTEVFSHVRCIPSVFDKLFLGKCVPHTGFVKVVWTLRGKPFQAKAWHVETISECTLE